MKKKNATRKKESAAKAVLGEQVVNRLREAYFIVFAALTLFLLLSLATYSTSDPGWSYAASFTEINNAGGRTGAWFADVFLSLFGFLAYFFPLMVGASACLILRKRISDIDPDYHLLIVRTAGFFITLVAGCGLASLHFSEYNQLMPLSAGGMLGDLVGVGLVHAFNFLGATLFLLALFLTGVTLFTGMSWLKLTDFLGKQGLRFAATLQAWWGQLRDYINVQRNKRQRQVAVQKETVKKAKRKPVLIEQPVVKVTPSLRAEKERQTSLFETPPGEHSLPPLALLEPAARDKSETISKPALEAMSRLLELKLQDFNVDVQVVAVHPGPVITRYELQLAPGMKVSKISGLAKDLARSLSVVSVRVVEVIPGKPVIGIEIPNENREIVRLSEALHSEEYDRASSALSMALGKDIAGNPVVVDLGKMPHLLVAGTTGSGKSVGVNAMILSLLYKSTPDDVRLIMIDPKMLELSVYNDIPHLLAPVVTDMKEAANALRWCVAEMERRYQLMAALGVRNITGYNRKIAEAQKDGKPLLDPLWPENTETPAPELERLPYVVVIVDEFADMIMVVGKAVEELIARIAQKARAAGIHLILATQRPSVDVITGLIKANVPTRIAFQVSSRIDSRTILDQQGAEQLLGQGDMLYLPPGSGLPVRVHGAFVADQEVHAVVKDLKKRGKPKYLEEIVSGQSASGAPIALPGEKQEGEADPLYDEAVHIVLESRRASISGVQRRLKIGYNRAARIIEEMEAAGVVSPMQHNGSREVLAPAPQES